MNNYLIFGASGAIGQAITNQCLINGHQVHQIFRSNNFKHEATTPNCHKYYLDVYKEQELLQLATLLKEYQINRIINCAGILHTKDISPEKTIIQLNPNAFVEIIKANTLLTALIAKHLLPLFNKNTKSVFAVLSARIGSISDNQLGGWYSYRASKAALNQILKTLSIEFKFKKPNAVFVALHPGTTDSNLSKPFQKNIPPKKLFTARFVAKCLLNIIETIQPENSGSFYAWDGSTIQW
ncbi:SDR family NAD(P)-dependent oxidoreductase [Kangiella sp. HZ709]|uniref:SDR family NAD(P)-dependent oxidoreductase n=1 Tax=Kangiella sp. HZ709 TaxID=2666328 RepID=UPI0012B142F6|nr:SDR family NAD(P)-dependent oxidoreductase [Kangiella sp. HZ709]MRX26603.1 SDR family NAD(P)-dependent oxidoreductase [Kangiella sp. HZ709]